MAHHRTQSLSRGNLEQEWPWCGCCGRSTAVVSGDSQSAMLSVVGSLGDLRGTPPQLSHMHAKKFVFNPESQKHIRKMRCRDKETNQGEKD